MLRRSAAHQVHDGARVCKTGSAGEPYGSRKQPSWRSTNDIGEQELVSDQHTRFPHQAGDEKSVNKKRETQRIFLRERKRYQKMRISLDACGGHTGKECAHSATQRAPPAFHALLVHALAHACMRTHPGGSLRRADAPLQHECDASLAISISIHPLVVPLPYSCN